MASSSNPPNPSHSDSDSESEQQPIVNLPIAQPRLNLFPRRRASSSRPSQGLFRAISRFEAERTAARTQNPSRVPPAGPIGSESPGPFIPDPSPQELLRSSEFVTSSALTDIYAHHSAPHGFLTISNPLPTLNIHQYREHFENKPFCPVVCVDLAYLKEANHLDLTPWLSQFEPLISIRATYSPALVKLFYHNLHFAEYVDNGFHFERLTTFIGSRRIILTPSYLSCILGIANPPPIRPIHLTNEAIFELLRPHEPSPDDLPTLSFSPDSMPPHYQAIWYIYARNLKQKNGNFSTFSNDDYLSFASIIAQVPLDIGHWVYQEITNFRFPITPSSQIPFPNLISVILFHEQIWHLSPTDQPEHIPFFSQPLFNLRGLNFHTYPRSLNHAGSSSTQASSSTAIAPRPGLVSHSQFMTYFGTHFTCPDCIALSSSQSILCPRCQALNPFN